MTRTNYQGLTSELNGTPSVGNAIICNLYLPCTYLPFLTTPYRNTNPTRIAVDTKSGYVIETANYQDVVLVNGGARFDDYNITSRTETLSTFARTIPVCSTGTPASSSSRCPTSAPTPLTPPRRTRSAPSSTAARRITAA